MLTYIAVILHDTPMNNNIRVCAIIPAYNEGTSIYTVVTEIRQWMPHADIVVMNDGSSDDTESQARRAGAVVLTLPFNLGIGGAVQTGLKYAYRNEYDVAIEIDADGQHDPQYAPQLVDTLMRTSEIHMVIGSRFVADTEYRSSKLRRFGIHTFSFLIKLVTGKRIYDSTSGYRAYDRRALKLLSKRYPADFPEPESIVMLLHNGCRITEVPVAMTQRQSGKSIVGRDFSFRAAYFVVSNAIAIMMSSLKTKHV